MPPGWHRTSHIARGAGLLRDGRHRHNDDTGRRASRLHRQLIHLRLAGPTSGALLRERGALAVNILHIGQQAISNTFASGTADRFVGLDYETWDLRLPIILDAMADFECAVEEMHEGGDHLIVVGRIARVLFDPSRDPLFDLQGNYRRVHVAREASQPT